MTEELIYVKGSEPRKLKIHHTHHGPIFNDDRLKAKTRNETYLSI